MKIYFIVVLVLLLSCSEENKQPSNHAKSETTSEPQAVVNKDDKLYGIISNYLKIKDALVQENGDKAAEFSRTLVGAYKTFSIKELNLDHQEVFTNIKKNSIDQLEQMSKNPIKVQREHFVSLSNDLYELVKLVGSKTKLYKEYCSMYKKDGGMWLSASNKIRNPYFGNRMLKCGKVLEEI